MNPELRRNLWLEFSVHRLLAMPAAIAIVAVLIIASSDLTARENVALFAACGYAALVLLWGTQAAAASVVDEARARTWDAQRMSAIGPWAMTWGKLVGAPSFAWYGGGMLLVLMILAGWGRTNIPLLRTALILVAAALLLHALALNTGVLAARKGAIQRNPGGIILVMLAFMLAFWGVDLIAVHDKRALWWRMDFARIDLLLASAAAFAAWAVLGAYRSMCSALEIRTLPWTLPAFVVFSATYIAGFFVTPEHQVSGLSAVLLVGTGISLAAVYLLLFTEQTGAAVWQRLLSRARDRQWRRAAEEMPVWLVALATGLIFAVAAMLALPVDAHGTLISKHELLPLAMALFAVRDAAIFQFFAFARQPRRPEAATLFYLLLLYWPIPAMLAATGATSAAELILPLVPDRPGFSTAVVAIQAAIAVGLALWRWRRHHAMDGLPRSSPGRAEPPRG